MNVSEQLELARRRLKMAREYIREDATLRATSTAYIGLMTILDGIESLEKILRTVATNTDGLSAEVLP